MNFFKNAVNAINIFRKPAKKDNSQKSSSMFEDFLLFLDKDDVNYENVQMAVELCDAAFRISKQRAVLENKLKEYNSIIKEIKCYEELTPAETAKFKELTEKVLSLSGEKNTLRFKMIDFDKGIDKLVRLETNAPESIKKMEEAEAKERAVLQDIAYIKAEREALEAEKESLEFADKFIYFGTIAVVATFSIAVMSFVFVNIFTNTPLFIPITILCFVLIFLIPLIIIFKRKIKFELIMNNKKQAKIISLLNKKNTVYAYYRGFLNYECKKYGVKNSTGLKRNLKNYSNYKHITKRYDNIKNIMYEAERELELFLREKNIKDMSISLEEFVKTLNIDDKIAYAKEIAEKRETAEKKLEDYDKQHELLWDNIIDLNINDKTESNIIEKMIRTYLEETEKLTFNSEE